MRVSVFLFFLYFFYFVHPAEGRECYTKNRIENFLHALSSPTVSPERNLKIFTLSIRNVPVDIHIPETVSETTCYKLLLVLPGWKYHRKRWFRETRLSDFIRQYHYIAVAPEMHTTIYESEYFPETKMRWHAKPGMKFLEEDFFPYFQSKGFFLQDRWNFGLGLSTGGRGIVLIASRNPGLFFAIATLSGDFDQTLYPADNLMRLVYGDYETFSHRWKNIDNPVTNIKQNGWKTAIFIGHGLKDRVVPSYHSEYLYRFLKENFPGVPVMASFPENAGHDFSYWNSALPEVFSFFENLVSRKF